MTQYKKESHTRSLIKGISWRIAAFIDTILVVALVTSFTPGGMNLGHAFAIGMSEFFIKFIVYYAHERIWESIRVGDGLDRSRTLKKAISWRIVASLMTLVIAGFVLKAFDQVALAITFVEFISKFALYYLHERLWLKLPLGRIRRLFFGDRIRKS